MLFTANLSSRTLLSVGAALASLFAAGSVLSAVDPPNPKDLTQGKWELSLDKSTFCNPQQKPQKSARVIFDEGWGLISVHWTGISANGKPMDIHYVYSYDGRKFPVGEYATKPSNESITYHLKSPSRVEFQHWSKDDKLTQSLVRTVSADGQTMTQTTKLTDRPGCVDVQVFDRQ